MAGFPSRCGGAGTGLDHLIDLFRAHDVSVNVVPMFRWDEAMCRSVLQRGCEIWEYSDTVFRDRIVISFANHELLQRLPRIVERGRPAQLIWFNCLTWLLDDEREAHRNGWIDRFGFNSAYQRRMLLPELEGIRPVESFDYRPYFNLARMEWRYRELDAHYRVGRISRDDASKFAPDTWEIFDGIRVPAGVEKKVQILGFGRSAADRLGPPPAHLDCQTWPPGAIPVTEFYRGLDTMLHKTGGSRESYCRVLIEAYAHGVVPIVERDYAFPELVIHGETGFCTSDSQEMIDHASRLAHDRGEHRRVAEAGRRHVERELVDAEASWRGWSEVLS